MLSIQSDWRILRLENVHRSNNYRCLCCARFICVHVYFFAVDVFLSAMIFFGVVVVVVVLI